MKIEHIASTGEPWFAVTETLADNHRGEPTLGVELRRLVCWATYSDGSVRGLAIGANGTPESAEDGPMPFYGYARSRAEAEEIYQEYTSGSCDEGDEA